MRCLVFGYMLLAMLNVRAQHLRNRIDNPGNSIRSGVDFSSESSKEPLWANAKGQSGYKPCVDTAGETSIKIAGKPATCEELAGYCNIPQYKEYVSKVCPKSCGACGEANAGIERNSQNVANKEVSSHQQGDLKQKKKRHCHDTLGKTSITIAGELATCKELRPYCDYEEFKDAVSQECPRTCNACSHFKGNHHDEFEEKHNGNGNDIGEIQPQKKCADMEGETPITIQGTPATCQQLKPYCDYPKFKDQVSKFCPKICGACPHDDKVTDQQGHTDKEVLAESHMPGKSETEHLSSHDSNSCHDTPGETQISISGKPATCADLAVYCELDEYKSQVSQICPKTCGICSEAASKAENKISLPKANEPVLSGATANHISGEDSLLKENKETESTIVQINQGTKNCHDLEGETSISIAGKPATCEDLAPYCSLEKYKEKVTNVCPQTCGICDVDKLTNKVSKEDASKEDEKVEKASDQNKEPLQAINKDHAAPENENQPKQGVEPCKQDSAAVEKAFVDLTEKYEVLKKRVAALEKENLQMKMQLLLK